MGARGFWAGLAGICLAGFGVGAVGAQETQPVTLRFQAMVGDQPFTCGQTYELGSPAAKMTASDFRLYLSELALIDSTGAEVPLQLEQDGVWQHQTVALLDFEDKSGSCSNGTEALRTEVVGAVPKGTYQGLHFTLGVPEALNHEDASLAPSPLNLTSLWWNWQGGYKFVRIDLESSHKQGSLPGAAHAHGHGGKGFPIHLGSTGCVTEIGQGASTRCTTPNRAEIQLSSFDYQQQTVVLDLGALVAATNVTVNQPETPPGCMSSPDDLDCASIMTNFGLAPSGDQTFFKAQ